MGVLITAGQLMLSLSILIVLHELGHFLPARLFGVRVEKFYLFFDPWFSLLKKKVGDTEYGIGWLPLGGYVKLSGMVDESFDREQLKQPPQEWEFRSKPAWQRLIIMLGGVTVNLILGFFIYAMVLWTYGEEYYPSSNMVYGIYTDSLGHEMGLRDGDFILSVGDTPFERFSNTAVIREIVVNDVRTITVRRDGQEQEVQVGEEYSKLLSSRKMRSFLFSFRYPFVVEQVAEGFPGEKAGFKKDDHIISLNGKPTEYFHEFDRAKRERESDVLQVGLIRNETDTMTIEVQVNEEGQIGLASYQPETERKEYSLGEAMPAGVVKGWGLLTDQVKAFGQMFRGRINAEDSLGGFGTIASMYGPTWNWERFWTMTAILSLILAFMNLLPIPALDGGHVMFLLYEVVSGRKPSDKFMEYATLVGFVLVIGLVLYVNGLDVLRWLRGTL